MVIDNIKDGILTTIYRFMRDFDRDVNSFDVYICVVYVLYGIHKQYTAVEQKSSSIFFACIEDELLNDIYEHTKEKNHEIHLYNLYRDLSFFKHEDFEDCYGEILSELANFESIILGRNELYTPDGITALMAYFVKTIDAKSVFDPFCGTSSIVHKLSNTIIFEGQELSQRISLIARVNLDAHNGCDNGIRCCDSIIEWSNKNYDAVITCPPFMHHFSMSQKQMLNYRLDELNGNLEEILFSRSFNKNRAKAVISLEPAGFCYSQMFYKLRKYLVDKNYLDCIIFLPEKLLYSTSIPCVIVICKTNRKEDEPIKMIDAQSYFFGESPQDISFDYERFVQTYEQEYDKFSLNTYCKEVVTYDYNLNFYLYNQKVVNLEEGQCVYPLGDLLSEVRKLDLTPPDDHRVFMKNHLSNSFDDVLLNRNKLTPVEEVKQVFLKKLVPETKGRKYILCLSGSGAKPLYAIYTDKDEFACTNGVKVFSVNEEIVSPEYLVYNLINNPVLKSGYGLLSQYMMLPIVVDSKDSQIELVRKMSQQYAAKKSAEKEADIKRLGVKSNISDLEHLLQTTQANIGGIIYDLGKLYPEDEKYHSLVKGLNDNVEYMNRVIRFSNATINKDMFNLKLQDLDQFIKSYCNAWLNYSGNYFYLSLKSNLGGNNMVMFDKTYLKLMLDSILTNVERHGFKKQRREENLVEISLSLESYANKPYVVLRVANNGLPFKKGFTLDDYKQRGRYSGNTGRSGLGGYHVFEIAKGHNGFLYIDSNKVWNVVVEVLLPIDNVESDNLTVYEHECI